MLYTFLFFAKFLVQDEFKKRLWCSVSWLLNALSCPFSCASFSCLLVFVICIRDRTNLDLHLVELKCRRTPCYERKNCFFCLVSIISEFSYTCLQNSIAYQWYQSSQPSQPIIGNWPSSTLPHAGHIQTWFSSLVCFVYKMKNKKYISIMQIYAATYGSKFGSHQLYLHLSEYAYLFIDCIQQIHLRIYNSRLTIAKWLRFFVRFGRRCKRGTCFRWFLRTLQTAGSFWSTTSRWGSNQRCWTSHSRMIITTGCWSIKIFISNRWI